MDIRELRAWMYDRKARKYLTPEFLNGVEHFVDVAIHYSTSMNESMIRCPCKRCGNKQYLNPSDVKAHIYSKGFRENYWFWTSHGEVEHTHAFGVDIQASSSTVGAQTNDMNINQYQTLVFDAFGPEVAANYQNEIPQASVQAPNPEAQKFYDLLGSFNRPLWEGCDRHTELSAAIRLMTIKAENTVSHTCYNQFVTLMDECLPQPHSLPMNFYDTKKLVSKLGLEAIKIDCYVKGCMLYYSNDKDVRECKACGHPRYCPVRSSRQSKEVPYKRMYYLPLISKLKRLYASKKTAEHITWHS
jgi:hypothetical protein